eukprot:403375732
MEDFDLLYLMKTPFYMGSFDKALQEGETVEINIDDQRNQVLKNLLTVRSLTCRNDFQQLKQFMQTLFSDPNQKQEVANFSLLVQYLAQKKIDVQFLQNTFDEWIRDPQSVQANVTLFTLMVYYFYIEEDYNRLFYLLNNSKNLEFLSLKLVAYLRINRADLGEQVLKQMKAIDEDSCITALSECWLNIHSSGQNFTTDTLINTLNELGEKYGYTTKTYNLLAISLMLKLDLDRAAKIFESALNDLQLDTPEGEAKHLYVGNNDLASLLTNYIKCNTMRNGLGQGNDYFKSDELNKRLFIYLGKINQGLLAEFFEERKKASDMFDSALKQVQ